MKLTPPVPLITLETGCGLRRGSHSPALRGTFSKGPKHCVKNTEKLNFGKGTQLIVRLGEYHHSDFILAEPPLLSNTWPSES